MNYDVNGKVNAIKTDIADTNEEEYDDYNDELNYESDNQSSEENNNSNDKNELKKKLIKLMILIGGGMLILLLLLFIISKISNKSYDYAEVENIMENAAKEYFNDHTDNLPKDETQTVEIEVATLVSAEKMKSLEEYFGENNGCTGKVQVKKSGDNYLYTPYLTCGDKYSTKFLVDKIANEANLVGSGYGLYLLNDNYVFRGEEVNNYVQLEAKLWRVVKVNSDKTITLTLAKPVSYTYAYDDRYNQEADFEYGINNFQTSRIREQLEKMYNTIDEDDEENYILSENDKAHLVNYDICVGKIGENETIHDNSIECSQTVSGYIGLLTVSDYMNASTDTSCNTVTSYSCQNYNYLGTDGSFWLVTPNNQDTYSAYTISGGSVKSHMTYELYKLRPVVTLSSNTLIEGGDGTKDNPYIVK